MSDGQRYNLLDEHWIPIAGSNAVSLKDVFSKPNLRALGGSVLEKISLQKLMQAIAQAAITPEDDAAWLRLGEEGMANACLEYLEKQRNAFWLYGPKPFLQYPAAKAAVCRPYGALLPEIADGNTTVLFQGQVPPREENISDSLRARILVTSMSCCFGGKKTDRDIRIPPYDNEDRKSAKPGPALCAFGLLHSFLTGVSVRQSVWFNLLTRADIESVSSYTKGLGVPPWEAMPKGENDEIAQSLIHSLMGRLVPMSRFLLLDKDGVHCVEGLRHPDYKAGMVDPSMASIGLNSTKVKMLWADPARRPWRSLTSLLGFLNATSEPSFTCLQLKWGFKRLQLARPGSFGIWSGGLSVSSNAGEQYMSGSGDAVESEIMLHTDYLSSQWFDYLQLAMKELNRIAFVCREAVREYYQDAGANNAAKRAEQAERQFWEKAEQSFQRLSIACGQNEAAALEEELQNLRGTARVCYDAICPQATARQLQLYVKHIPRFGKKVSA